MPSRLLVFSLSVPVILTLIIQYLTPPKMSFYRNTVWFMKGMREYTKTGYEAAAKSFIPGDLDVDVKGKAFLITGSNSGIGKETALEIARRGGTVHIVCRNVERGEEAKAEIQAQVGEVDIHVHKLDISDSKAVHAFAREFAASGKPLHCLVNNAGCMVNQRQTTSEGIEINFATNSLGTYILTTGLIDLLKNNSGDGYPRVVTVSSGGMLTQKMDVNDLMSEKGTFEGTQVYAQQKRQQIFMTESWAKEFPDIHFSVMHPGWADTPAVRSAMPGFYEKMKDRLRSASQGADTVVWLALSPSAVKQPSGLFFQDRVAVSTHLPLAWTRSDPSEERQLIEALAELSLKFKPI